MIVIDDEFDSPAAIRESRRRRAALGVRMQMVAARALEELEAKIAAGQPLNMTREQAETLRNAGEEIEREALGGDPTDLKRPN